jgi:hypothetical protein
MNERTDRGYPPKIIWLLWLQGWDNAPDVVRICGSSWERRNPGWRVHFLDQRSLSHFLPAEILEPILATPKEPEALSDQIRLELLHRYGGVWADATTVCAEPLDCWLAEAMPKGFFAFARPGPDRMISTWFLAAEKGAYIVEKWREAAWSYWTSRTVRDSYFWVHNLFAKAYDENSGFRDLWDNTPQMSAVNRFHFGPNSSELLQPPPPDAEDLLAAPPVPVFKLTHKFDTEPGPESLFARICNFSKAMGESHSQPAGRRLLVGWFGSFSGHGTIGDLRSLEAVVSHLVGRGHEVLHATADPLNITGATRVDWTQISADSYDAVIFVCGPILRHHPETRSFFARFSGVELVGLGVSLLPEDHPNHLNPFNTVFARQGMAEIFGDVAVSAPLPAGRPQRKRSGQEPVIGLALRGDQHEYGAELCLWREAAQLFEALTDLLGRYGLRIVEIENHLLRSQLTPNEIEQRYAECDLVLTTRFHGAITSLRQQVPFIALDQIRGGAKVLPLLKAFDWKAVFGVDAVDALEIIRVGLNLLHNPDSKSLVATSCHAIREANRTLVHLDGWAEGLESRGR